MDTDPLQKLVSEDFQAEDREKLANLLLPYVVFDKNSKEPHFKEAFYRIPSNADKLELVFLVNKAGSLLFYEGKNEGLSQGALIALKIMPDGSIKSTLKRLSDNNRIRKNEKGYYIPNYRLPELLTKFSVKEKGDGGGHE